MTGIIDKINDKFSGGLSAPADYAEVPAYDTDFKYVSRGIYVAAAGDVAVKVKDTGAVVIFKSVPAGFIIPIRATQIASAGSTVAAANLLAMA